MQAAKKAQKLNGRLLERHISYYESLQAGKTLAKIVAERGIDPEMLGVNRVNGLKTMVLNEVKAGT